jgi:Protein of unknown function (DUF1579)
MRTTWKCAAVAASVLLAGVARAQEKKAAARPEPPKPGPEVEKLRYFLGEWTSAGEMKAGPAGPAGKMYTHDRCEWIAGNFFVACNMASRTPLGAMTAVGVMGWDADRKHYTWWHFDSAGGVETATGRLEGGTWTWSGEAKVGDRVRKTRYVIADTSPEGYAFRWEISDDGKAWSTQSEAKFTKVPEKKE